MCENAVSKGAGIMLNIGHGFWNIRASLQMALGLVDIGTHMSIAQLSNGKFLVIDTCELTPAVKTKIDEITNGGILIEAVIATHPFHTLFFPKFYNFYPNVPYYGTPRHLRRLTNVQWTGTINAPEILSKWEKDGVYMRVPAGAEFDNPTENDHFSGLFVYHQASKTIHIDDTIMYYDKPGFLLRCAGKCQGKMEIWDMEKGIKKTKEGPLQFKQFLQSVINDWDFDNICTAHTGNKIGGAKALVQQTLLEADNKLQAMSFSYTK